MDPLILSIAAFVGVAALVGGIAFVLKDFGSKTAEDRLEQLMGKKKDAGAGVMKEEILREGMQGVSGMFSGMSERLARLSLLFEQADSPIKPDKFFLITAVCAVLGAVGGWIGHAPAPLLPVCGIFLGSFPLMWLLMRRKRRFKKFANQLSDALELIARALRSGHSLSSALRVVCDEMPLPISAEFSIACEEQNLNIPIDVALKNMLRRMPNMDLKFFVTAVAIQRQAGGDMAEILDKISYIIRERFKIMGQVQALTGEGRISGVVLMGLPIALFFAVYYLNPDYVMLLFTDALGKKMIAAAAVLQIVGAVAIKKIVAIKI